MHVNHRLRPQADEEALVVRRMAEQNKIDFIGCQVDVESYSCQQSVSIEEAARILRYRALFEHARAIEATAVAVGHNADDQVETILLHLLRGTGLAGLRGMEYRSLPNPWSNNIPLVRPLLSTPRADILRYIDSQGLEPVQDLSNLDPAYLRNRLRLELLPFLEGYNPNIREVLLRMAESLKDDYSALQENVEKAWEQILIEQGDSLLAFQTPTFLDLPRSTQRDLIRKAIQHYLPGLRDVGFDCIERGLTLIQNDKSSGQVDLIAGLRLLKDGGRFWVLARSTNLPGGDFPAVPSGQQLAIPIPGNLPLNNGWQLVAEQINDEGLLHRQYQENKDPYQVWMDVSDMVQPLFVRARMPGDQMKPLGMHGQTMKISDLMINLKLPYGARSNWPLIYSGDDILWVPGFRLSHLAQMKPGSHQAVHLTLTRR